MKYYLVDLDGHYLRSFTQTKSVWGEELNARWWHSPEELKVLQAGFKTLYNIDTKIIEEDDI